MKVVTVEEMQRLEQAATMSGITTAVLMESAGRAIADEIMRRMDVNGRTITVLIGPGNNGGDGLVAAHYLAVAGAVVHAVCAVRRPETDPNLARVLADGVPVLQLGRGRDITFIDDALTHADVVLDALLGTGRSRPLDGPIAELTAKLNDEKRRRPGLLVVAVDLPTGLNADTGELDPRAVRADLTLALGLPKVGQLMFPGADAVGELRVLDIGLPPADAADKLPLELIMHDWAASVLPPRPRDAHKGAFGRLLIIGGCAQYYGAPVMAAAAALRSGVGLATIAAPATVIPALAVKLTEATYLPLPDSPPGYIGPAALETVMGAAARADAIVLGCGIGLNPATNDAVRSLLPKLPPATPLLLDADALTVLAQTPDWWERLPEHVILTPHAGEMGRLLGTDAATVQADRLRIAREAAQRWRVTVVLKGAGTIVASPDGTARISSAATPALATAGTGDCLAGTVGALLAQGVSVEAAAALGVYLNGEAGLLAEREIGLAGTMAGDILERLPRVMQSLRLARAR